MSRNFTNIINKKKICQLKTYLPCGGGEVPLVNLICGQSQKCPFSKTDSLETLFFWKKQKLFCPSTITCFCFLKKKFFFHAIWHYRTIWPSNFVDLLCCREQTLDYYLGLGRHVAKSIFLFSWTWLPLSFSEDVSTSTKSGEQRCVCQMTKSGVGGTGMIGEMTKFAN